ncbi:hypothetical protein ACLSY8_04995 [Avibacterium avium]|uniref:hypothetical protein n=1 Tax=Avibacterium TaxID=292486 RepID=UPI003BF788D9
MNLLKKLSITLLSFLPLFVSAEYYKVEVSRIDTNLYKTSEGIYIETKYCHEYANRDEAILSYEQYSYDNKIIFNNGSDSCDIKRIFK